MPRTHPPLGTWAAAPSVLSRVLMPVSLIPESFVSRAEGTLRCPGVPGRSHTNVPNPNPTFRLCCLLPTSGNQCFGPPGPP